MNTVFHPTSALYTPGSFQENTRSIEYYVLDDGRIWSVKDAAFVSNVPENAVAGACPDSKGDSSIDGLKSCLDFYGYEKGSLA